MIVFEKIIANDCFSYSHLEFEFKTGLFNISGANGAGKSSLPLMMQLCLFNRCSKNSKIDDTANLITGKPFDLTCYFTKNNEGYRVENNRKLGTIKVFQNNKNISQKGITANLKLVEDILGCSYDQFVSMTYQCVESSLDLLEDSKDSARKQFVDDILKFDELDTYIEKFELKRKELSGKNGKIASLTKQIESFKSALSVTNEEKLEVETSDLTKVIAELEQKKETTRGILADLKSDLKKTEEDLATSKKNKAAVARIAEIDYELKAFALPARTLDELTASLSAFDKENAELATTLKSNRSELKRLQEANTSGKCDSCGSGVAEGFYNKRIEFLACENASTNERLEEISLSRNVIRSKMSEWKNYFDLVDESKTLKATPNINVNYDLMSKTKDELDYNIKFTQSSLKTIDDDLLKVKTDLGALEKHNQHCRAVRELNRKISESNQKIQLQIAASEIELVESERKLDIYVLWLDLIAKFKLRKMSAFLLQLNKVIRDYLKMFCGGSINCQFVLDESGKIVVALRDVNKEQPYSNWSSGQKARVKLSVLFSVMELLEITGKVSFNVLVLDEIFNALDAEGKDGLVTVLQHLKSKGKAVYTIAHSDVMNQALYDGHISVKLSDGLSYLNEC